MRVRPLADCVVIREEQSEHVDIGGLRLLSHIGTPEFLFGEVVAVGPGERSKRRGKRRSRIPVDLQPGMRITYRRGYGLDLSDHGMPGHVLIRARQGDGDAIVMASLPPGNVSARPPFLTDIEEP